MSRRRFVSFLGGATAGAFAFGVGAHAQELRVSYPRGTPASEFPDLSGHYSYMAAVLTKELYCEIGKKRTQRGVTFDQVIQSGVDNPSNPTEESMGCFAGDEESYYAFQQLFNRILHLRHGYNPAMRHESDLNPGNIRNATFDPTYILGVRIRVSRNLTGHRFSPAVKRGERKEIERAVLHACGGLSSPFQGRYYSVSEESLKNVEKLTSRGYLFTKPTSPQLLSAGFDRDWPSARGAYVSHTQALAVWINEQDHIRVIAKRKGGDLHTAFNNVTMALLDLETGLREVGKFFSHDNSLGYLGPSLANIGSGMKITVEAKFPNLLRHPGFRDFLRDHQMASSTAEPVGGVVDISSTTRMLKTETRVVSEFADNIRKLIAYEKMLEEGQRLTQLA